MSQCERPGPSKAVNILFPFNIPKEGTLTPAVSKMMSSASRVQSMIRLIERNMGRIYFATTIGNFLT